MKTIITNSEKETLRLAKEIAAMLRGGDVLALKGDLGAGKTVLVKGIARALGIKKTVISPTFVIMMLYRAVTRPEAKIRRLCHIDAYRIGKNDLVSIGAPDYFARQDTVTIIEWADKVRTALPKKTRWVEISNMGKEKRRFKLKF